MAEHWPSVPAMSHLVLSGLRKSYGASAAMEDVHLDVAALILPLALPGISIGLDLLRLLQRFTMVPAFMGLLAMHVVLVAPFMLGLLRASVQQLERVLQQAYSVLTAARGAGGRAAHTVQHA